MELQILLAGVEFGPYTDDKVRQLLGDGFLSVTDPAKRLDGTDWQPLSAVLGEAPPAAEAVAPEETPAVETLASPTLDESPAEEAVATTTEDEPANSAPVDEMPLAEPVEETPLEPISAPVPEPMEEDPVSPPPAARSPEPPPLAAPAPLRSPAPPSTPAPSQAPRLQVSIPSRAKKGAQAMRTGSLLAKEALQAARDRSGILAPVRPFQSTTTAPVPEFEPEPAPPRRRTPVKLGEQPEATAPAPPPQRKAIKLSGRVGLPGTAPQSNKPAPAPSTPRATTSPRLPASELAKFSGFIARPGDTAKKDTPAPERTSGLLRERRETGPVKPAQRKAIKLTGPVSLPGRTTEPTPPVVRAPQTDDDDGPMVMARTSRPIGIARPLSVVPPEPAAKEPVEAIVPSPPEAPAAESEAPKPPVSDVDSLDRPAEIAALAAVAAEEGTTGVTESPETEALAAGGSITSELAARRSLKITGSLRPPSPGSGPIQLSSPSVESGPLVPITEASFTPPAFHESVAPWPSPPIPEEDLPNRPPTGKIPVHQMPTEGVKVRTTRRLTTKVPLPATSTEALAHESPARADPPPLPRPKIELPSAPSFEAPTQPAPEFETPAPAPSEPISQEQFVAATAGAAALAAPPPEIPRETPVASLDLAAAPAETVARPEKARLRRPVNLDLSSRAKPQDSGRITLETFSKLAFGNPGEKNFPPVALKAATPEASPTVAEVIPETETPTRPEVGKMPPEPSVPVAAKSPPADSPLSFPKKLEEAPPVAWGIQGKSGQQPSLIWLFYSIIVVGAVAGVVIIYLLLHRVPTEVPNDSTPAASLPAVPASAAPPASAQPPASASPPGGPNAVPAPTVTTTVTTPPATATTPPFPLTTATPSATPPPASAAGTKPNLKQQAAAFVSDGILKYQHNDLDGAIGAYNQALNLDPKSAEAFYNRGIAKAAQNDLDGSIADYSQAIQVDPNFAAAYYYRGLARHSKADLDGAINDYNQAVQLNPNNAMAFFNRGLIRMQKDDIDGSIVDSSRAIELDPHQVPAYYDRGLGRLAKGAMDAALDDMRQFTQLAPQSAYTDYARLYIWLIQTRDGQLADANADLGKSMNNGWNGTPDSMVTRLGEYLLGQISESDLLKASTSTIPVKDQGQRCEAWYFIGMRKLVEGDKDAAVAALRKCVGTQKTDYCEYILAQEELRTLAGSASVDTNPPPPRALPVSLPDPGTVAPGTNTTP